MEDLSLHILDIVENSIRASAKNVRIKIIENPHRDRLSIIIRDDGKGMDPESLKRAFDPFFTTKDGKKVGLGLSLLAQSAEEAGGFVKVKSKQGKGTIVKAIFKLSHIDRKPIGNLDETIKCLRATHRDINFIFEYERSGNGGQK